MRLITAKEAAVILQVNLPSVWEMVRHGIIPAGVVIRLGKRIRFNEERLVDWLDAGGQAFPGGWKREREA